MSLVKKLVLSLLLLLVSSLAWANEYIIVVPFPPGGGTDSTARYLAKQLTDRYNDKFIVINRPGANGMIGFRHMLETAKTNPNVIYFGTNGSNVVEGLLNPMPDINVARDSKTLFIIAKFDLQILALKDSAINTLADVKNQNISSYSAALELFARAMGMDKNGNVIVPYKGEAPARLALLSKEVPLASDTSIMTDDFRSKVKVVANGGPVGFYSVYSFDVPNSFDTFKLSDLNTKLNRILRDPEVQKWFESRGLRPLGGTPEEGDKIYNSLRTRFAKVVDQNRK